MLPFKLQKISCYLGYDHKILLVNQLAVFFIFDIFVNLNTGVSCYILLVYLATFEIDRYLSIFSCWWPVKYVSVMWPNRCEPAIIKCHLSSSVLISILYHVSFVRFRGFRLFNLFNTTNNLQSKCLTPQYLTPPNTSCYF